MKFEHLPDGSGKRALEANQAAIERLLGEKAALVERSQRGELVDKEILRIQERIDAIRRDKGNIESAGI